MEHKKKGQEMSSRAGLNKTWTSLPTRSATPLVLNTSFSATSWQGLRSKRPLDRVHSLHQEGGVQWCEGGNQDFDGGGGDDVGVPGGKARVVGLRVPKMSISESRSKERRTVELASLKITLSCSNYELQQHYFMSLLVVRSPREWK